MESPRPPVDEAPLGNDRKNPVYLTIAMAKQYSHSASWTREILALALFAVGFAFYDARDGGEYARIAALLMMLGAGAFMCFAIVERIFFLPRIMRPENRANSPELVRDSRTSRHSEVNYDGPRVPRPQTQPDTSLRPRRPGPRLPSSTHPTPSPSPNPTHNPRPRPLPSRRRPSRSPPTPSRNPIPPFPTPSSETESDNAMSRRAKSQSAQWRKRQERDPYIRAARAAGYRSRAAFKLLQIHQTDPLFHPGAIVADLGAAPGGWTQIAAQLSRPNGKIVAADLLPVQPVPGAIVVQGDFLLPATQAAIADALGGPADLVLSDLAPNLSGIPHADAARAAEIAQAVADFSREHLRAGGKLLMKSFAPRRKSAPSSARTFPPPASATRRRPAPKAASDSLLQSANESAIINGLRKTTPQLSKPSTFPAS